MEARLCSMTPVVVAGGGNSAGQAAMFLAETCSSVTVVIRGSDLGKSMSRYLVSRIEEHPRISVSTNSIITALQGDEFLSTLQLKTDAGDQELECVALFSFIGADPGSEWLSGCAALDQKGFMLTDRALEPEDLGETWEVLGREPLPYETNRPGLFAVGDVRSGSTKRVATAVGEGSGVVRSVHEFLSFTH
jgi:thioredoxin reductase (NADPH)